MNMIITLAVTVYAVLTLSFVESYGNRDLVTTPGIRNLTVYRKNDSVSIIAHKLSWRIETDNAGVSSVPFYPGNTTSFIGLPVNFTFQITIEYDISSKPVKWMDVKTLDTSSIPINVIPGKPRNISICDASKKHVCFQTPKNILNASTANDKNVEYLVKICHYNPLIKSNSNCIMLGVHIGDNKEYQIARFDTLTIGDGYLKDTEFFKTSFKIPTNRDIAAVVEPYALNGKAGEKNQLNIRLDSSKKPTPPNIVNLVAQKTGGVSIKFTASMVQSNTTYRIKFQEEGTSDVKYVVTELRDVVIKKSEFKEKKKYIFQAAVDDSVNGASDYSPSKIVTTLKPAGSSSSVIKLNLPLMLIPFVLLVKLVK